ncbi:hypothetical protein [Streptomyces sp. NPDC088794]|uniref:hypothetical protein n=1 Tax=Streptomyces sp. NPDC088794 TaxID=3365902 RepID=UPI00382AD7FF
MTDHFQAEDLEAVIAEGSLVALFTQLAGRQIAPLEPAAEDDRPKYHIPRKGAWPCGTAPSGPTPPPCGSCPPGTLRHDHEETQ